MFIDDVFNIDERDFDDIMQVDENMNTHNVIANWRIILEN